MDSWRREQKSFLKKVEAAYFVPVRKRKGKDFYSGFYKLDALLIFLQDMRFPLKTGAFSSRQIFAFI